MTNGMYSPSRVVELGGRKLNMTPTTIQSAFVGTQHREGSFFGGETGLPDIVIWNNLHNELIRGEPTVVTLEPGDLTKYQFELTLIVPAQKVVGFRMMSLWRDRLFMVSGDDVYPEKILAHALLPEKTPTFISTNHWTAQVLATFVNELFREFV